MKFLEGKKTYISAAVLIFVGAGGYFFNAIPAATALALIATGMGFVGVGSKVERYSKLVLAALDDAKKIQADLKAGNRAAAAKDATDAATEIGMGVAAGALDAGRGQG